LTLFPTLPFIQGPPPEPFKIGLELFQLYPVWFFPEGRAIVEADLSFPEGSSIGYASGKPASLAVIGRSLKVSITLSPAWLV
jgi:hypothetical protein